MRDRIKSARMPRVALENPLDYQENSWEQLIVSKTLYRIIGARREKTTRCGQHWRQNELVRSYDNDGQFAEHIGFKLQRLPSVIERSLQTRN